MDNIFGGIMNNTNMKSLLTEYDYKRRAAIRDLEERKASLYLLCPELENIEKEISNVSIRNGIAILKASSEEKEKIA